MNGQGEAPSVFVRRFACLQTYLLRGARERYKQNNKSAVSHEDMVEKDEIKRDLTASSFDWKTYLQGMPKLQNDLQVLSFCAELHRS